MVEYFSRLNGGMEYHMERKRALLQSYKMQLGYLSPINQIREKRTYAMKLEESLQESMNRIITRKRHELEIYIEKLKGLSPLDKLNQGFSHTSVRDGETVTKIEQVEQGEMISVYVSDGKIEAIVENKEQLSWE